MKSMLRLFVAKWGNGTSSISAHSGKFGQLIRRLFHVALLSGFAAAVSLGASSASATAIAHSDLVFHNFAITPSSGSVQFTGPWILQSQASADNSLGEFDSAYSEMDGAGTTSASAAVTWASAGGVASVPSPTPSYFDIFGGASADGNIPGMITGSATAMGRGTVRRDRQDAPASYFQILGGTVGDTVSVTFDVLIDYSLKLETDQYGLFAEAEAIFAQELFGEDVGFLSFNWFDRYWAIGSNSSYEEAAKNLLLSTTIDLRYGAVYSLFNESDAEIRVGNVPEPATLWLVGFAIPLMYRTRLRALSPPF